MADDQVMMELGLNGASKHQIAGSGKQGATVSFHNIHYKVTVGGNCLCRKKSTTRVILSDVSGIMKPGLNAIMGPTGSGKSSFLDVLAARKDPAGLTGEVLIDGAPQPPNFKCLSGYVVQDDVVMGTLTVRENFSFSAALRLPSSIPQREKEQKVNTLIKELGLGRVADSRVGTQLIRGISGGERKRTNIGMELIIDPSVLFLDEPTTGLDANTANSVLLLLKRMANHGRTIILSIHQPRYSIYRLFDSLTLLVNGKQVYHGLAQRAVEYFSDIGYTCEPHNNPADFFLDVINGDSTAGILSDGDEKRDEPDSESISKSRQGIEQKLVEVYRNCHNFKQTEAELERIIEGKPTTKPSHARTITYNTGFLTQFRWVLKRTFRNLLLNPQTSIAQVGVTLFLALVVGALFFDIKEDQSGIQNRFGVLFFVVVNQCFSSLSAAELFIAERKIFIHESISGYYRVSVYFLAKMLSDILTLRSIPSMVLTCVAYFMIGLKPTAEAFFLFMFTLALVAYTATSMALAISADQTVVAIANIYMTICTVFMMIFAGLLVNLPSIVSWLAWLKYLSIPRYGFSALQINEFTGLNFCQGFNISDIPPGLLCTGEEIIMEQGVDYSAWGFWQNHMALCIMIMCFLTIAYLKLRFIKKFT
ncbi:broad substrate specificity ATP-binding cassette transporter ABCG2-like [Chelmon rostratus]|uniref:broad substrate specificity ATP-binding cassette transporter ABCG2-like n=1 Tax=Chelmon rostratus TaxID=109905 RepID=UPI001BE86040|nr:broad substrate specificity ATP-binding cassette transporter ABCG2-like [Chelmon rostratus]XP_041820682.1 broad substrate specificity ATP-binding cassette transporter ABCG2-like [Chelmon rostratus]